MGRKKHKPVKFDSITDLHLALGFERPIHPLISLVNYADIKTNFEELPTALHLNFYKISYKGNLKGRLRYGQTFYDFGDGGLCFFAPNQIVSSGEKDQDVSGCTLLLHPDFIRNSPIDARIKRLGFFSYSVNEALLLTPKERGLIVSVFDHIREELNTSADDFSHELMIAHLDVLLTYSNRFYSRQFKMQKAENHELLTRMDGRLAD